MVAGTRCIERYAPVVTVYVKKEPWPAIRAAVRATKGQVFAASGYVNNGAFEQLPLRRGDVLVCDVSPATVSSGATNPAALVPYLKAGVQVFSKPGLHAKVVVLPRRAFVGSANASANSANRLFEAVLETTAAKEVGTLRRFIRELCTSPVTIKSVLELSKRYPRRPKLGSLAVDPSKLPERWDSVTLIGLSAERWTTQETYAWEKGKMAANDKARNSLTGYHMSEFAWSAVAGDELLEGQWVVQIVDGVPEPPGVVVHRQIYGRRSVVWLATPKQACRVGSADDLGAFVPGVGEIHSLRGVKAQQVLDIHRRLSP